MKVIRFPSFFFTLIIALGLIGCSQATKKGPSGDGDTIEPSDTAVDGTVTPEGDIESSNGESSRPVMTKDGVEWGKWEAIHFDLDSTLIRSADHAILDMVADWAKNNSGKKILISGHCDERGSLEYNRALGQRRASVTRSHLIKLGVPAANLSTVSYGEEQPVDNDQNEDAWTQNRRAEFGTIK